MAINPENEYPGRIEPSSASYPYGAIRDESIEGAEDGTPLQQSWARDIQGFFQSLLSRAGITPSGDPDTVLASDYMDALTGEGNPIIPLGALTNGDAEITQGDETLSIQFNGTGRMIEMRENSPEKRVRIERSQIFADKDNAHGATFGYASYLKAEGIQFLPLSGAQENISPFRTSIYDASGMAWTVDGGSSRIYYSATDKVLNSISWDSGANKIISVSFRFKRPGDSLPISCPMQCIFKNNSGTLAVESASILSTHDPDLGTDQQIVITYETL